MIELACVGH